MTVYTKQPNLTFRAIFLYPAFSVKPVFDKTVVWAERITDLCYLVVLQVKQIVYPFDS